MKNKLLVNFSISTKHCNSDRKLFDKDVSSVANGDIFFCAIFNINNNPHLGMDIAHWNGLLNRIIRFGSGLEL